MKRRRKQIVEVSEAFRRLRRCYPRKRLLVILDNLHNGHDHPRFLTLLRRLRIHPVWTPAEASWLNLIEAQFGVLKRFTVAHTDDPSHAARRRFGTGISDLGMVAMAASVTTIFINSLRGRGAYFFEAIKTVGHAPQIASSVQG